MNLRIRLISIAISCGIILFVLDLVRRRKLKERYSLLWCWMCVSFILLALRPVSFDGFLSRVLGVHQTPNLFFLAAVIFLITICIHYSVRVSALSEQTSALAQELALLTRDMEERKKTTP
ncbi:MAG: DUF2304 domain-containing protein [Chlamydiota bacterium]